MRHLLFLVLSAATVSAQDGAAIYKQRCAGCHDAPAARVPPFSALRAMDAASILRSLETGLMKTQAAGLTNSELYALVTYLASPARKSAAPPPAAAFCGSEAQPSSNASQAPHWSGWGGDTANTRFQNATSAGITAADVPKLKLKWAFALGDGTNARSQPAVADGRVFIAGLTGDVYSLDARTGCIHWTFAADAPVRTASRLRFEWRFCAESRNLLRRPAGERLCSGCNHRQVALEGSRGRSFCRLDHRRSAVAQRCVVRARGFL